MFFFGLKEFQGTFAPIWNRISTDKIVACQYPNDADGNAFRQGFEPLIQASGYKVVDGGAYTDGTTDFTSMISKFKSAKAEVFSNCPLPPDFNTFWKQASQQGFKPKIATVAKVLLFPADTVALGPLVNNIATDSWWGPYMPNSSSLVTGLTREAAGRRLPVLDRAAVGAVDRLVLLAVRGGEGGVRRGLRPARRRRGGQRAASGQLLGHVRRR